MGSETSEAIDRLKWSQLGESTPLGGSGASVDICGHEIRDKGRSHELLGHTLENLMSFVRMHQIPFASLHRCAVQVQLTLEVREVKGNHDDGGGNFKLNDVSLPGLADSGFGILLVAARISCYARIHLTSYKKCGKSPKNCSLCWIGRNKSEEGCWSTQTALAAAVTRRCRMPASIRDIVTNAISHIGFMRLLCGHCEVNVGL